MINLSPSRRKKRCKAFTLIEIMVATVIMIILVGLVIQITSEVLNVWNRSSGKLSANAEARIAMDLITQDLETAVFRNNSLEWFRAEDATLTGPGGELSATVALRLFAPVTDRPEGPGDICAVAYKLDYVNPVDGTASGADRTFVLYRLVVDAQTTFNDLMGDPIQATLPGKDDPTWGTESIIGDQGSNYLVSNIVEFKIDFHVTGDGTSETSVADGSTTAATIYGGDDATVGIQATDPRLQYSLAYAEINLTVVSDQGIKMLQNIDRIPETVEEVVIEYGQKFVRRVNFIARAL
ncbi:MAG: prepilin-type N-terminal cleavage/methylation domain-containing protein [Opitutales bacterium]|jgi:type II secretory pathway component PulJ|nr:prepilin-type N-terminal cleavage/methylation domain-containing protein [Opitutales bacterium]MDP4645342.1 prepilin-type N-terminal cleavage/methylation domain-containing protein [Opitutales bacterium]MDP4693129.1 prepilin-type N-terminal cleavage/methylation domain-containing protein [Opitutales bacterium]MDP4883083.1 prepilin-type N-terminal cleavage/methylation domain-containing protein [Opitutales bacterium]MDP5080890.1 prepilin-type N-terminal cleavage/methylation domain-containing prot